MSSNVQFRLKNDTVTNWTGGSAVTLAAGEPGYDTTNKLLKLGDGSTAWSSLLPVNGTPVFVDVKTLGAIGNGQSNTVLVSLLAAPFSTITTKLNVTGTVERDWLAIQTACYYSGSSVYIPPGVYQLGNNKLTLNGDNITILGAGMSSTILTSTQRMEMIQFIRSLTNFRISNIRIQNDYNPATWDAGTTYATNNFVQYGNLVYQSVGDANVGNIPRAEAASSQTMTTKTYAGTATFTNGSPNITFLITNFQERSSVGKFIVNQTIRFTAAPPTPYLINTTYYIFSIVSGSGNTAVFTVSATLGAGATGVGNAGSGGTPAATLTSAWTLPLIYGSIYCNPCELKNVFFEKVYVTQENAPLYQSHAINLFPTGRKDVFTGRTQVSGSGNSQFFITGTATAAHVQNLVFSIYNGQSTTAVTYFGPVIAQSYTGINTGGTVLSGLVNLSVVVNTPTVTTVNGSSFATFTAASTANLYVGMNVNIGTFTLNNGTGFNGNGIIINISGTTIVVSIVSTVGSPTPVSGSATLTAGSASVVANLSSGMFVNGIGITPGTYIIPTTTSGTWTLSQPATAIVSGPLTFSVTSKLRIIGPGIPDGTYLRCLSEYGAQGPKYSVFTLVDYFGNIVNATSQVTDGTFRAFFESDSINFEQCTLRNTGMMGIQFLDQSNDPISVIRNVRINRCLFDGTGMSGVPGNAQALSLGSGDKFNITNNDFRRNLMGVEFFLRDSVIANNTFGEFPDYHSRMTVNAVFNGTGSITTTGLSPVASPYGSGFVTYASLTMPTGTPMANGKTSTGQFYPGYSIVASGMTGSAITSYSGFQSPTAYVDTNITIGGLTYPYAVTLNNSVTTTTTFTAGGTAFIYSPCAAGNPIGTTSYAMGLQKGNKIIGNTCTSATPYAILLWGEQDLVMEANRWVFTSQPTSWGNNPGGNICFAGVRGMRAVNEQYITDSTSCNPIVYNRSGTQLGTNGIATGRSSNHQYVNCSIDAIDSTVGGIDIQGNTETLSFVGCTFAPSSIAITGVTAGTSTVYTVSSVFKLKIGMTVTVSGITSLVASCIGTGTITLISGSNVTVSGINSTGATSISVSETNGIMTYIVSPWTTTISAAVVSGADTRYTVTTNEGIVGGMTVTVAGCVLASGANGFNGTGVVQSISGSIVRVNIASTGTATAAVATAWMQLTAPALTSCNTLNVVKTAMATASCTIFAGSNILTIGTIQGGVILTGYLVTGTGIPANTYITSGSSSSGVVITSPATSTNVYLINSRGESVVSTSSATGASLSYVFFDVAKYST